MHRPALPCYRPAQQARHRYIGSNHRAGVTLAPSFLLGEHWPLPLGNAVTLAGDEGGLLKATGACPTTRRLARVVLAVTTLIDACLILSLQLRWLDVGGRYLSATSVGNVHLPVSVAVCMWDCGNVLCPWHAVSGRLATGYLPMSPLVRHMCLCMCLAACACRTVANAVRTRCPLFV